MLKPSSVHCLAKEFRPMTCLTPRVSWRVVSLPRVIVAKPLITSMAAAAHLSASKDKDLGVKSAVDNMSDLIEYHETLIQNMFFFFFSRKFADL